MTDLRSKAVQMVSQEGLFEAIAYAALKARAGRFKPGDIIKIGCFEFVVAEDEDSYGTVVQIIETMSQIESLAMAKAEELCIPMKDWSNQEKRAWMALFYRDLADVLRKWHSIEMHHGPGDNLTIEKAVSK